MVVVLEPTQKSTSLPPSQPSPHDKLRGEHLVAHSILSNIPHYLGSEPELLYKRVRAQSCQRAAGYTESPCHN